MLSTLHALIEPSQRERNGIEPTIRVLKQGNLFHNCPEQDPPSRAVVSLPHHRDTVVSLSSVSLLRGGLFFSIIKLKLKQALRRRAQSLNALCRTRTYDPLIKSQLLCQLS